MITYQRLNITLDSQIAKELTRMVESREFPTKSFAIESAVREYMRRKKNTRRNGGLK